jgi:hypothetical protein
VGGSWGPGLALQRPVRAQAGGRATGVEGPGCRGRGAGRGRRWLYSPAQSAPFTRLPALDAASVGEAAVAGTVVLAAGGRNEAAAGSEQLLPASDPATAAAAPRRPRPLAPIPARRPGPSPPQLVAQQAGAPATGCGAGGACRRARAPGAPRALYARGPLQGSTGPCCPPCCRPGRRQHRPRQHLLRRGPGDRRHWRGRQQPALVQAGAATRGAARPRRWRRLQRTPGHRQGDHR